jgi:toxin-antitoxin system PIN domain toxin
MKHLLDVNVLLAAIWKSHPQNSAAFVWLRGKSILLCPIVELGFLRISSNHRAFNVPMEEARIAFEQFASERGAERIADDLPALESKAKKSDEVTDTYLANLAAKHEFKLATFDENLGHQAAEMIPNNPPAEPAS